MKNLLTGVLFPSLPYLDLPDLDLRGERLHTLSSTLNIHDPSVFAYPRTGTNLRSWLWCIRTDPYLSLTFNSGSQTPSPDPENCLCP